MPETFFIAEPQNPSRPSRWGVLAVVGFTILIVAIPLVIARTVYTAQGVSRNAYMTELLFPTLSLLLTLGGVLLLRQVFGRELLDIAWFRWNRREIVRSVLLIVAVPILYGLTSYSLYRFGLPSRFDHKFYADGLPIRFFVAVTVYRALAGPFAEALFYRGAVQTALTPATGAMAAWVIQAAVFAGMHLRPIGGFVSLFVFGLLTGLWRWRRRTLLPIILAHVALNSLLCAARWPGWLDMTRIRIAHDYVADLVELSRPGSYDPNDDARYEYERAVNSFRPIPDELDAVLSESATEWDPQQRDAIREWFIANNRALAYLTQGAGKPYYWPVFQAKDDQFPSYTITADIRDLAFALKARIKLCAWEGREKEVVRDAATLYRFGIHFGGKKALLDQLAGISIRGMTCVTIRKVLASHSLSMATLDSLFEEFQAFSDVNDCAIDFSRERLFCLNEIQKIFTDDGHGHGHVVEAALDASPGMTAQVKKAWLKLGRYDTTQTVETFFEQIEAAKRIPPWERRKDPNGVMLAIRDLIGRNAFLRILGPACVSALDNAWMEKAEQGAVLVVLASRRFEVNQSRLPVSLEELVDAGYLDRLPRDGFGPGPLVCRCTEEGFLLYSYGCDFDDDSGTPSKWGTGPEGGDQVFWPVED